MVLLWYVLKARFSEAIIYFATLSYSRIHTIMIIINVHHGIYMIQGTSMNSNVHV